MAAPAWYIVYFSDWYQINMYISVWIETNLCMDILGVMWLKNKL